MLFGPLLALCILCRRAGFKDYIGCPAPGEKPLTRAGNVDNLDSKRTRPEGRENLEQESQKSKLGEQNQDSTELCGLPVVWDRLGDTKVDSSIIRNAATSTAVLRNSQRYL